MAKNEPTADPFVATEETKPVKVKRDRTVAQRAQLLSSAANYLRDMAAAVRADNQADYDKAFELYEAHMEMFYRITNVFAVSAPTVEIPTE